MGSTACPFCEKDLTFLETEKTAMGVKVHFECENTECEAPTNLFFAYTGDLQW